MLMAIGLILSSLVPIGAIVYSKRKRSPGHRKPVQRVSVF